MCRLGADYILSATPYYNKPTQEGLYRHFASVADASEKPVVLYNVPGRTAVNLMAATALRLAEHPNVIGIKEASGDLKQVMEILARPPGGLRRALGRRLAHAAGHRRGRRRLDLGDVQRGARPDDRASCTWCSPGDLDAGAPVALPPAAAHGRQLPGDQPGAGEGRARAAWGGSGTCSACRWCRRRRRPAAALREALDALQ